MPWQVRCCIGSLRRSVLKPAHRRGPVMNFLATLAAERKSDIFLRIGQFGKVLQINTLAELLRIRTCRYIGSNLRKPCFEQTF